MWFTPCSTLRQMLARATGPLVVTFEAVLVGAAAATAARIPPSGSELALPALANNEVWAHSLLQMENTPELALPR